ncbi:MAG: hypothetical protein JWR58_4017 [Pseudonocardia sp.]|jgi:hypothetical protein|nr:hypothetical protein [Pseudonocardia sp.]
MTEMISDVEIPDTRLVAEATELVREAATPLIHHHSRRVYLFGSLRGREQNLKFDPELLYVGANIDGIKDRPEPTFGNVKADVLEHFVPGFRRGDFVEVILGSDWAE